MFYIIICKIARVMQIKWQNITAAKNSNKYSTVIAIKKLKIK